MKHLFFFVVISYYVVHSATCSKINRLHFESPFVICMYFCTHVYKHIFSKSGLLILLKFYMLLDHYGNRSLIYNLFIIYSWKHSLPQERTFFTKLVPKSHYLRFLESAYYILTHFKSMFHFCIPWKHQKNPRGFQ